MQQEQANPEQEWIRDVANLALAVQQEEVPAGGHPWRVSVRSGDGSASAAFTFGGYEQVLLFERCLAALGYEMLMLDERFRYCDFVSAAPRGPAPRRPAPEAGLPLVAPAA